MIDTRSHLTFPSEEIDKAIIDAETRFPNESCGIIVDNKYLSFANDAEETDKSFLINHRLFYSNYGLGKIQAVIHSHNNNCHASKLDQKKQKELELPFIIINVKYGKFQDLFYFGFKDIVLPYEGRPFHFGCWDCLTLTADYFKEHYGVELPNPPRDFNFMDTKELTFEKYINDVPFNVVKKEDIVKDDVLFYTWHNQIGHIGVYLGDDKVLAHWGNQLSGVHPLSYKYNHISFAMELK